MAEEVQAQQDDVPVLENIWAKLKEVESQLKLPGGVLQRLNQDQDHLAVLKMVATLEPLLSDWIRERLVAPLGGLGGMDPEKRYGGIADYAADLQLHAKIEFAKKLDLFEAEDLNFIKALARIRNRYAHHVANAERPTLYLVKEHKEREQLMQALTYGVLRADFPIEPKPFSLVLLWAFSHFLSRMELRRAKATLGLMSILDSFAPPTPSDTEYGL